MSKTLSQPQAHPLAELIPAMSDQAYYALRDDIAANGLIEPITTYEEKVLDGRHRLRACDEVGLVPESQEYGGDDPAGFVISKNLHRRHLTTGQRSHAALALLGYEKEQAKRRQGTRTDLQPSAEFSRKSEPDHKRASAEAGKRFGVSRDSVEKARALANKRPDLAEKVKAGELSLNAAIEEDRGYSTAGRRNGGPPSRVELKTERQRQVAGAARTRIEKAVGTCNGMARGLDGLKVDQAVAVADAEEVNGWDQSFKEASAAIGRLRKRLKETP